MELFVSYLVATIIIVAIPGPNILLIVSDSTRYGFKKSLLTGLGVVSGMTVLFSLSLAGITTLLLMYSWLFSVIKWLGVGYLIYLGASQFLGSFKSDYQVFESDTSKKNLYAKGFLISVTNPKGLVFAGAFFPQFLNENTGMVPQVVLLCGTFLLIAFVIGVVYAFCCSVAGKLFKTGLFRAYINRISGGFLIFFGIGLAFAGRGK